MMIGFFLPQHDHQYSAIIFQLKNWQPLCAKTSKRENRNLSKFKMNLLDEFIEIYLTMEHLKTELKQLHEMNMRENLLHSITEIFICRSKNALKLHKFIVCMQRQFFYLLGVLNFSLSFSLITDWRSFICRCTGKLVLARYVRLI